jgi:phage/plasmid-associated DNA primase
MFLRGLFERLRPQAKATLEESSESPPNSTHSTMNPGCSVRPNGYVDLKTGTMMTHSTEHIITKYVGSNMDLDLSPLGEVYG